jgi:hypothetical protein
MDKVRDSFDYYRNDVDDVLYYNLDEYNRMLILSIGTQITKLEDALNDAFVGLVNESSDYILAGNVKGFTADDDGQVIHKDSGSTKTNATWLYVDPTIDNDINATDATTGTGGWWYLVESNTKSVASGKNAITTEVDNVIHGKVDGALTESNGTVANEETDDVSRIATATDVQQNKASYVGQVIYNWGNMKSTSKNVPITTEGALERSDNPTDYTAPTLNDGDVETPGKVGNQNAHILHAKLFEVKPNLTKELMGKGAEKVVSVSFPFVNGNFELPGKEMTNIFANARISFKISFQALQAFFPYAPSVDGLPAGSALAGTAKALNIENSIPIFNEAFNYLSYISSPRSN